MANSHPPTSVLATLNQFSKKADRGSVATLPASAFIDWRSQPWQDLATRGFPSPTVTMPSDEEVVPAAH